MIVAFVFLQALALAEAAPVAADPGLEADAARFHACVEKIDRNAQDAYEDAMIWDNEEHVRLARECAAMALVALERYETAAERFESLAYSDMTGDKPFQIGAMSQAANAWLLARNAERARAVLDRALSIAGEEPDLLIDRARAHAMAGAWAKAEDDLSRALDKRPDDALALRLRAQARLEQNVLDLALKDAEDAVRLDPTNIDALLVRGDVRAKQAKNGG